MSFIQKYKPKWGTYIKDDDIEIKVLEFNKEKEIRSKSLDETEANLYLKHGMFIDYYIEKYNESIESIDELKNKDLLNLVCSSRV